MARVSVDNRSSVRQARHDPRLFTVPQKVQQFMDNVHNELKYVETDVVQEKARMNAEVDSIKQQLIQIVEN